MFARRPGFPKILALVAIFSVLLLKATTITALDSSASTTISVTAANIFAVEFYTDQNVIYSTTIPFSNIDPSGSLIYPNARSEDDGKSDTGVVCISNVGTQWYLKLQAVYSAGLPTGSVKYYYSQPWNRNTGNRANGTLTNTESWRSVPETPTTIYTSGSDDTVNAPFGTLSTFSFAVDPKGLTSGSAHTVAVTYTMTTVP
jgi:hypothetical protein